MIPGPLEVSLTEHGDAVHLTLRGEFDISTAPRFGEALRQAEAGQPETLVIDLSELAFMDSTGLRELVNADAQAREAGRRLVLVRGSEMIQRVLRLTRLEERFEIVEPGAPAGA